MLTTLSKTSQTTKLNTVAPGFFAQRAMSKAGSLGVGDLEAFALSHHNIKTFRAGQTLVQQGEPCNEVFILLDGWAICQKMLEDGGRQIVDLILPGNIFGFNVLGGAVYGVEAKTDCKVAVMSKMEFRRLLLSAPDICLKCAEVFASAESRAFERLSQVGRLNAKQRVASLIVELALRLRSGSDRPGHCIELPLTQIDIADMLGLAHETVCRVLVAMRTAKLTTWRNGKLEIHDLEALIESAGVDVDALDFDPCDFKDSCSRLPQAA